jgi:NAD(P)-dependent dehydrogenase (short-subunit alcohol dehydrogenase family)
MGVPVLGARCNIMEQAEIGDMVARTVERFGRVDGLINNAQTFRPLASIAEVDEADVDVFYTSGVKGTLWAMQAVYPHMARQGWGRIVNFASSMGITGGKGFAAYNASKEAIRALTRTAAREWAPDGIVVNCIAPAAATHHGEAGKQSEGYRIFIENCPMGRQGDPELDMGPLAWFLCSDACRYLTGHTFMADGGAFMWA